MGSPEPAGPALTTVEALVWVADRRLQEQLRGKTHGGDGLLCFRESLRVINATHLAAVLESRLQGKHHVPVSVGLIEHWDDGFERWLPLQGQTDIHQLANPVRLRVWGRKRRLQCTVLPLRQSAVVFAPRAVTVFADSVEELAAELRQRLPQQEANFGELLYFDEGARAWVLLEDIAALSATPQLKLVPGERALLQSRVHRRPEHAPDTPPGLLDDPAPQLVVDGAEVLRQLRYDEDAAAAAVRHALSGSPGRGLEFGDLPAGYGELRPTERQRRAGRSPARSPLRAPPAAPRPPPALSAPPEPYTDPGSGPRRVTTPLHFDRPPAAAAFTGAPSGPPQLRQRSVTGPERSPRRQPDWQWLPHSPTRSELVYQQEPQPQHPYGSDAGAIARLRDQVRLEGGRRATESAAALAVQLAGQPAAPAPAAAEPQLPQRITVSPMPHVAAEVRRMHCPRYDQGRDQGDGERGPPRREKDHHRDLCCYPGSGQVHSVESSGHGGLKRAIIAYCRRVLQEGAPGSPIAEYLPYGGLTMQQLVNVTALAAHHFMIRCPPRPHDADISPEDKAALHTILAHILADLPGKYRAGAVFLPRETDEDVQEAPPESARAPSPAPPLEVASRGSSPVVVLMRPMLAEDLSLVIYGTVTCSAPVTCRWELRRDRVEVPLDPVFASGLAHTEPVSASSFCLRLLPGALHPTGQYVISLHVTSDADGQAAVGTQQFHMPPPQ